MGTRISVNGEVVEADGLAQAVADAPAEAYFVVGADDVPVSAVMWDGAADYRLGDGLRLVRAADWRGAALVASATTFSGGGGGGGSSLNGFNSGAGGAGGPGLAVIVTECGA